MKVSGIWVVLYLVIGSVLMMFLNLSSYSTYSPTDDVVFNPCSSCIAMAVTSRKLLENGNDPSTNKKSDVPNVNLEDYRSNDPVPISKTVNPGPIDHGTPLNPYIPKPSPGPPDHPKIGGFA